MLEKAQESSLDCKEIKAVNPKGNQLWIFIRRTVAEVEAPIHWSPDMKSWLTGKTSDVRKDWGQEKKEVKENEVVGWNYWLNWLLLTMPKPLTVWIKTNCGKFLKRWEYQTSLSASWETYMQVKKKQLELDVEQQTGSKLGNEYVKSVFCHSAYLTYM